MVGQMSTPELLAILSSFTAFVVFGYFAFRKSIIHRFGLDRDKWMLLGATIFVGAIMWPSDYTFKVRPFFHRWEQYHLFMAAKYFPETGYEKFYTCVAAADLENDPRRSKSNFLIRDPRSNLIENNQKMADQIAQCPKTFDPRRWADFKRDVAYFSKKIDGLWEGRWLTTFKDFGINVTPFWAGAYHALVRSIPATDLSMAILSLIDLSLVFLALMIVFKSFGFERLCLVILFLGLNEASRPGWIVGSVFRFDWFFLFIFSLAQIQKLRPDRGLVAMLFSNMFRPVLLMGVFPPLLALLRERSFSRIAGIGGVVVLAAGVLTIFNGRNETSVIEYAANSKRYISSHLANSLGLRPLLENLHPDARLQQKPLAKESVEKKMNSVIYFERLQNPLIENEIIYREIMESQRERLKFAFYSLVFASIALLIWFFKTAPLIDSTIVTSLVSLLILSPPSYYTMAFCALFLMTRISNWGSALLFLCLGFGKLVPLFWTQDAYAFKILSLLTLVGLLGAAVLSRQKPSVQDGI